MAKYLIYAVNYNTKQTFAKSREPREFIKYNETNMREAYFCDLARITNTHFWIPLSIKIKLFNAYLYSHNWKYWKTICTKLQTFTKLQYLQYSSSEILENASFFSFFSSLPPRRNHWRPSNSLYWQYVSLPASFWGQLRGVPEPKQ